MLIVIVLLSNNVIAIPNPSAVYCEKMGYTYRVDKASEGEIGICIVKQGVEFKAWDFFRGKVGGEYSYCAKKGYDTETGHIHKETYSIEYAVCVSRKTFLDDIKPFFGITTQEVRVPMSELMEENGESLDLKSFEIEEKPGQKIGYKEAMETYQDNSREVPADFYVTSTPPALFDWRNKDGQDWVTPVKSQASCGSCWAFSAVGTVEAKLNIDNNNSNLDYDLSEQELVSCSDAGDCVGGWNYKSFNYIRDTGVSDEDCFPYVAADVSCDLCSNWQYRKVGITSHHKVTATQAALKQALLDYGPLSVPVESTTWSGYSGGIFVGTNSLLDHLVLLTGYNDTGSYWIIKNSWGAWWGEDGYMRLSYTNNPITSFDVTYAVDQTILPIGRGELKPYLINPVSPINITKNKFFNFSTGVRCVDGYCGDVTATLTLPPSEMTTCSEVWGGDCSEPPPESFDNTFDNCSSGNSILHSIGEVYIESSVEFGEEITVACYFDIIDRVCGTSYSGDNLYIYYRNSSSEAWKKKYDVSYPILKSCQNYSTSFFPDNVEGEHQVRCIAGHDIYEGECGDSAYFDNDDANFSVYDHSSGKGKVPMDYGNPFYTINQNPFICIGMTNQSTCNQTWTVNATGNINSSWPFYTIYSSPDLPRVETNKTEKINLTIIAFTNNILTALIELSKGWNLVSLILSPLDNTLPNVLSSIQGNYSKVVAYDANDIGNESRVYDPNDLTHSNLNSIEKEMGVWINMLKNDTLVNEGYELSFVNFNLKQGYNLISYPSLNESNVSYVFGNVSDDLVNVLTYENNEWKSYSPVKPTVFNSLTKIKPGQSYWVEVNNNTSWDFSNGKFSSH